MIHCTIHGQGVPLVLFHGWGFDSHVWHFLLPLLQDRYRLYLVDLPGFGKTPPLPGLGCEQELSTWLLFKTELLALLPQRVALLGWSMGGLFATRLAYEEPERVSHVIHVASSPRFLKDSDWPGIEAQVFTEFYTKLASSQQGVLDAFVQLQMRSMRLAPHSAHQYHATLVGLQTGLMVLSHWDLRCLLPQLPMPVSYWWGRLDAIIPAKLFRVMTQRYPQFSYQQFRKSAHMPFLSETQAFVTALDRFIKTGLM